MKMPHTQVCGKIYFSKLDLVGPGPSDGPETLASLYSELMHEPLEPLGIACQLCGGSC